jgi:hypothetical protein
MAYIDYGLSVLRHETVRQHVPPGRIVDLAEVYRGLSHAHLLAGYEVSERFYEIGSPAGLEDLRAHLQRVQS